MADDSPSSGAPSDTPSANLPEEFPASVLEAQGAPAFPEAMEAERFVGRNYFEAEMRPHQYWKLRAYHEDVVQSLATRLSLHLRMPVDLKLVALDTPNYEDFRKRLQTPIHIAMVKAEPGTAINIVALHPALGLTIADRLMGGPGVVEEPEREMTDIEAALLHQAIQIIMSDYFKWIPAAGPLKPLVIAHESHPSFLKKGGPDHRLMVLTLDASVGEVKHSIEMAMPFELIGGLIEQFRMPDTAAAGMPGATPRSFWTEQLQGLPMGIEASWQPLRLSAGQIGRLRVGDVIPMDPEFVSRVQLRLGPKTLLVGRLGSVDGQRAVQLTSIPTPLSAP